VYAFASFGDLPQAISVSRDGEQGTALFSVTGKPWGLDAGANGDVFVSTMDNPADLLRFSSGGGTPDRLGAMSSGLATNPVELDDGSLLIPSQLLGRRRLLRSTPDGPPRPLLDLAEQATPPATTVGTNRVAFLSGRVGEPSVLTLATLPEGRVVRRLEETRGIAPQGLVAAPDGRTLYYVNAGSLYAVDVERGVPRRMRAANGVALDAREPASLIVQVNEADGVKLFRVPLAGGSELSILFAGPLRLAPIPISGAAVGPDGRIAVTVTAPDLLWRGVALLDPATATLERVALGYDGDVEYPVWSRDGSLIAIGLSPRSSLWRFQPTTPKAR
jgi:hypothetical protein